MKKIQITDTSGIEKIIENSGGICQLSLIENNKPYCIPMNFGYKSGIFYFHGAPDGKKINALKINPDVCLSIYSNAKLNIRHENVACSHSMNFKSLLAHGKIRFIEDLKEKCKAINIIMKNYTGRDNYEISKPALSNVSVYYLEPEEITAFNRGCE